MAVAAAASSFDVFVLLLFQRELYYRESGAVDSGLFFYLARPFLLLVSLSLVLYQTIW